MRTLFFFLFFIASLDVEAQDYTFKYFFDENFNSVDEDKAVLIGKGIPVNGLMRLDCFNVQSGQMVTSAHFKDSSLAQLQGPYVAYYDNGKKQKEGYYGNNIEWGVWQKWDLQGRLIDSALYKKGKRVYSSLREYHSNNLISSNSVIDSNAYVITSYDSNAVPLQMIILKDTVARVRVYTNGIYGDPRILNKTEFSLATFAGGPQGWTAFIRKNLDPAVGIENNAPSGTYQVIMSFMVDKDGVVSDIQPETQYGYGMENEVYRVINSGPKWVPATVKGEKIISFLRQPVTFVINND